MKLASRLLPLACLLVASCEGRPPASSLLSPPDARRSAAAAVDPLSQIRAFYTQRFTRTKGAPDAFDSSVSTVGYGAPFIMHVVNGAADGSQRISSGEVALNGTSLLGSSDFSRQASRWDFPASLSATAFLTVELRSAPGSYITISIDGRPLVMSLPVAPASATVIAGKSISLTATPLDVNGSPLTDRATTWSSSNDAVAAVDATGHVSAVTPGSAVITANCEGRTTSAQITVIPPPVAIISVTPATSSIVLRTTFSLSASLFDAGGNRLTGRSITWASSAPAVASVDGNGVVGGSSLGTATITATSEGVSATAQVSIVPLALAHVCPGAVLDGQHFATIAAALAAAPSGATLRLCNGDFDEENTAITRAVTIENEADAIPVIHNTTSDAALVISGSTDGAVTLRGLSFRNEFPPAATPAYSVRAEGVYGVVNVESSHFKTTTPSGTSGTNTGGIRAIGGPGGVAQLNVKNSTFAGGFRGITMGGATNVTVTGSSFTDHSLYGVFFNNSAQTVALTNNTFTRCGVYCMEITGRTATITDNTASSCGTNGCVDLEGGTQFAVDGNSLSNRLPTASANNHIAILAFNGSYGRIENNTIDGCGFGECIVVDKSGGQATDVVNNRITAYFGEQTRFAIIASDGALGASSATNLGGVINVQGNTIIGIGGLAATAPADSMSYPFRIAAVAVEGHSLATVRNNSITNIQTALQARTGSVLTASGNVVTTANDVVVLLQNGARADVHGNDFTGYLQAVFQSGTGTTSDLSCNWWGATGPVGVASVGGSLLLTPTAAGPVARSGLTCP